MIIVPAAGLRGIKTREDVQNLIHVVTLAAVPLLVSLHIGTQDQILAWAALLFAAVDPIVSFNNSPDNMRKIIYGVGGLVQAILIGVGTWSQDDVMQIGGAVMTFLVSLLAAFYTPTSGLTIAEQPAPGGESSKTAA